MNGTPEHDARDPGGRDWTEGGDRLLYQRCTACGHVWYFRRGFCPACGDGAPERLASAGAGTVHATTLVHRAPDAAFRAEAPYRLALVDLDEGFRVMAHADRGVAVGDRVRFEARTIAGRVLPHFSPSAGPAP